MSHLFVMSMWFPYYFARKGLVHEAPYLSSIQTFFFPLGVFLFDFLYFCKVASALNISYAMQLFNILAHIFLCLIPFFWGESAVKYALCLFLIGFSYGGPFTYHSGVEMKVRCSNPRELYLILSFSRFLYQLFTCIELVIVGFLMEKSTCLHF